MNRVVVLSAVLLAALAGSYLTWTADDSDGSVDDGAVVYAAAEADLQKITLTSTELDVTVEQRADGQGTYIWVETVQRKEVVVEPEPDAEAEADSESVDADASPEDRDAGEATDDADAEQEAGEDVPADAPQTRTEETRKAFRGNDAAAEMWASFAPLAALRELEISSPEDRAVFGFDEPEGVIAVTRRSGVVELTLGGETYGSKDRYLQATDRVFLVDDAKLRPLLFAAQRLVERRLQPLAEVDIERVEVSTDGLQVVFAHQNADDRAKAFWSRADSAETADENAGLWLGKLLKLRLVDYANDVDTDTLETVFAWRVVGDDAPWSVQVQKAPDGLFYATSTFNRAPVKLTQSLAGEVVADLEEILATE